jgi:serine/threonine-protein kinase ULK4
MDKYHIYEEIGKGEFSQVFKGREKKKIEYVAIKRVEKSMMSKVVNEVQVMHKLESPHILKFHDWYETRNNLWLILEYCTGADLESLLKQDGHLPEASVRMFGLDMVAALKVRSFNAAHVLWILVLIIYHSDSVCFPFTV